MTMTTTATTSYGLHTPERHPSESPEAYKARRALSKEQAKQITGAGLNAGTRSREQYRDNMRKSGTMGKRIRAYKALLAAWAAKVVTKAKLRDEHGAYTLIGANSFERRKWLGGISAQRGY